MKVHLLLFLIILGNMEIKYARDIVPVDENTTYYNDAVSFMNSFKEAIFKKDYDTLESFTFVGSRQWFRELIKDERSFLYRRLFIDSNSAYRIIAESKQLGLNIFVDVNKPYYGTGTWGCFFDKSAPSPEWSKNYINYVNDINNPVFCVYFIFDNSKEKRWIIPYGFAYECPDD